MFKFYVTRLSYCKLIYIIVKYKQYRNTIQKGDHLGERGRSTSFLNNS